jgi:hypothetical protein
MSIHWLSRAAVGAAALLASTSVVTAAAPSALAAIPTNDTLDQATVVTALPFSDVQDVAQATTDAQDAQLNASCGAPATEHSVWYAYTPAADGGLVVDVSQSDFPAAVIIGAGTPGALETSQCGSSAVGARTVAGTTYYILVFDYVEADPGGTLRLSIDTAPAPPTMTVTVASRGAVDVRTGIVTLHGTYTCTDDPTVSTDDPNILFVDGELRQSIGRAEVTGQFDAASGPVCDGTTQPWSADVLPQSGKFVGGKAITVASVTACHLVFCGTATVEQTVLLSGSRK